MKIINPIQKSRPVRFLDIPRVIWDSWRIKWAMRKPFDGRFPFAASISHCQITNKDPLRFFVVDKEGGTYEKDRQGNLKPLRYAYPLKKWFRARTIINPVPIKHGTEIISSLEGCMGDGNERKRRIRRYENVWITYWTFFGKKTRKFSLYRAILIQHELDHFDNISIEDRYSHKYPLIEKQ
jgi:peptide deformylase